MSFFGKTKKRPVRDKKRRLKNVVLIHITVIAMMKLKTFTRSVVKEQ